MNKYANGICVNTVLVLKLRNLLFPPVACKYFVSDTSVM